MLGLEIAGLIIAGVGVLSVVIGLITFIKDIYRRNVEADTNAAFSDEKTMSYFASKELGVRDYLCLCRNAKISPQRVPKIQKIVQLGDDLFYTSKIFDHILTLPPRLKKHFG